MIRKKSVWLAAAITLIALATAGCGSSSKSSSSSSAAATSTTATSSSAATSQTASAATGSPIKIGNISPVSGVLSYPGISAGVKAAVRDLNSHGGINGHRIDLIFCDEASNPNKASSCAREMVSDHVAATVSDFSPTGEQNITPILAKAKIPQIGTYAFSTALADPYNFLLAGETPGANAASAQAAALAGKKWGLLDLEVSIATAYTKFYDAVAKARGATVAVAHIPITSTDASPLASTLLKSKPDLIILQSTGEQATQVALAAKQLGYTGKFAVESQSYVDTTYDQLAPVASQTIFVSEFPPVSETAKYPAYKQFLTDMNAEAASGDSDAKVTTKFVQDSTINGWLSVMALKAVAGPAKATTAPTILSAFRSAKNVKLGIIPPWTPNKPGPKTTPRISVTTFYYEKIGPNGTMVSATPPSYNVSSLLGG